MYTYIALRGGRGVLLLGREGVREREGPLITIITMNIILIVSVRIMTAVRIAIYT